MIRVEREGEIIYIFVNYTRKEGDVLYARTSVVLSIKEGEVNLYRVLR